MSGAAVGNKDISKNVMFNTLRERAHKGVDSLNKYLSSIAASVNPPKGAAFALNIIFHMFVLFFALTTLYKAIISPMESKSLQNEIGEKLAEVLTAQFKSLDAPTQTAFADTLRLATPLLLKARTLYTGKDTAQTAHNDAVFSSAWTVVAILGIIFVVVASVLAATSVSIRGTIVHVLAENAIIFAIIGIVEFSFFTLVAKKFVPVMPSQLGENALDAVKASFSTAEKA